MADASIHPIKITYISEIESQQKKIKEIVTLLPKMLSGTIENNEKSRIGNNIQNVPLLQKLYFDAYDEIFFYSTNSDNKGEADKYKKFAQQLQYKLVSIENNLSRKISILKSPNTQFNNAQIQIDRKSPAYRKIVDEFISNPETSFIPLPKSTTAIAVGASTHVTFNNNGPNLVAAVRANTKDRETELYKKFLTTLSGWSLEYNRFVPQTPVYSTGERTTGYPEKEILYLFSNEIPDSLRTPIEEITNSHKINNASKTKGSEFSSEEEFLDKIKQSFQKIHNNESLTIIIHAHGESEFNPNLPKEFQGLIGSQKSYFFVCSPNGERVKIYHDRLRKLLFEYEKKENKVANLISITCYPEGAVAKKDFGKNNLNKSWIA